MQKPLQIGEHVYHRSVYEHTEKLKIVGLTETEVQLEGDFSGDFLVSTHDVSQKRWLPIKGTSRIYKHAYKEKVRKDALNIQILAIPCAGSKDNAYVAMMDMSNAVLTLTSEVSMNPEF